MKILVFAPGIMGSELRLDDEKVWPPTMLEAVFGYDRFDSLIKPNLTPTGIISKVGFKSVYATLLNDISVCGYSPSSNSKRFVPFPYDWRLSNEHSADLLATELRKQTTEFDPNNFEIYLLGHSMGGLVMRCLLESGKYTDEKWFNRIKWLVTLGTPHYGAPLALHRLKGVEGTVGLKGSDIQQLARTTNYSALYELVSPKKTGFTASAMKANTLPKTKDPFSTAIANSLKLNNTNVSSARSFWSKLDLTNRPSHVEYFFLVSSAHTTLTRNELSGSSSLLPIERSDSGDGTVPIASAVIPTIPHSFSKKKHESIFLDRKFRRYLYKLLDAPSNVTPQSAPSSVEPDSPEAFGMSLDKESYAPGDPIELSISYNEPKSDPSEAFSFVEIDPETGHEPENGSRIDMIVRFRGVSVEGFKSIITNGFEPGIYELQAANPVDDAEPTYLVIRKFNE